MASDEDFARDLEAFKAEYRWSVADRLVEIESHWTAVQGGAGLDRVHALLRALHSIAGSAGTFGMESLGHAAAAAEAWLEPYHERASPPPAHAYSDFEALLGEVRKHARA